MVTDVPFDIPAQWTAQLAGYSWSAETTGRSGATVFRLYAKGRLPLFVKTELRSPFSELPDEIVRLRWLSEKRVACASILAHTCDERRDWLMMSALPGRNLASSPDVASERIAEIAADALKTLHQKYVAGCPFDHRVDHRIIRAEARMRAGLVDEADFDEERRGRPASDLFQELLVRKPDHEDLVVTHGDACLPNLFAADGRFAGFIDCGRLGISDRHQDLALAGRSIRHNLGRNCEDIFLRRYGITADPKRLAFYVLLDEFF